MRKVLIVVGAVVFGSLLVLLGASMGVKEARAAADPVMLAAGDIASCESRGDEATAELLDDIRGRIVTLGDNAYPDGSLSQFRDCYGPSWGRHKDRTRPAPGNHEYYTPGAERYFDYFSSRAGNPAKGYYSYDRGTWHIVVLNSNCSKVGGCEAGSAQGEWLRADLAAHPNKCTLAYFHAPSTAPARSTATAPTCARSGRPSTGERRSGALRARPRLRALRPPVALCNGIDPSSHRSSMPPLRRTSTPPVHPQDLLWASGSTALTIAKDPYGTLDRQRGIRQFVVGTGGAHLRPFGTIRSHSRVRNATAYGVLKLRLHAEGYGWKFVSVAGETFTDSGKSACHQ